MSNDHSERPILPQSSQMTTFSYAPQQYPQRETQRNYVFVDEHNRHKRLKVMRACEGCRRRKIKCDSATTNVWPCTSCLRLKLHCVRPNGQYDGTSDSTAYDSSPTATDFPDPSQLQDSFRAMPVQQQQPQHPQAPPTMMSGAPKPGPSMYAAHAAYPANPDVYQAVHYAGAPSAAPQAMAYPTGPTSVPMMGAPQQYTHTPTQEHHMPSPPHHQGSKGNSPDTFSDESYQQQDLSELLGSLKVDEAGTAPYLRNKASFRREEEPAIEEMDDYKNALPPLVSTPGLKIRIPPELMPDDQTATHYFDLFFAHMHPYIPVLSRSLFYQQWNSDRYSISPLILEAMFAIGGRLADEPALGQQWLALASKHADSFMDVPRLSTLQALLLILKARESAPQRGYYYRSWMTITQCVNMGKDLGLDEHYADHQADRPCGESNPVECQLKRRIWQAVFVVEVMIGSPQGRTDLNVRIDSVDFSVPRPIPNGDEGEYQVSRNFTYFSRIVRNVSTLNSTYGRIKKKKAWGVDPDLVQLGPVLDAWQEELPGDLAVTFPPDGSAPWLQSPFIGNMHSYYHLAQILLHRPQLAFNDPNGADGRWKQHMLICYSSAKALCRLQEAVLGSFGFTGLQCMQRGYSYTIYCGLSCIVLHLVAITSPDPVFNTDAREYFTRHMRVLEKAMSAWPMAEVQKQVDAVREAFSADIRKPFVLKPSFPYGSPHTSNPSVSPPAHGAYKPPLRGLEHGLDTQNIHSHPQVSFTSHPITPPISAGPLDANSASPTAQSLVMLPNQGSQTPGMASAMTTPPAWNPQRIFDQWNTSFGAPQVAHPTSVPTGGGALAVSPTGGPTGTPPLQDMSNMGVTSQQLSPTQYSTPPVQNFVTPAMWQESVASVYEGGLKRGWDYDDGPATKRTR